MAGLPFAFPVIGALPQGGLQGQDGLPAEEAALVLSLGPGELESLVKQDPSLQNAVEQLWGGARVPGQGLQFVLKGGLFYHEEEDQECTSATVGMGAASAP